MGLETSVRKTRVTKTLMVGIFVLILGTVIAGYGATYDPFPPGYIPREKALIIPSGGKLAPATFNPIAYVPGCDPFMQEPLFVANIVNGSVTGWLATGYEYNEDYTQLKIFLRSNVKWSDGVPFTARDLAFTINTLATDKRLALYGELNPVVDRAEATTDLICTIYFKKPSPRFITYFIVEFCQPRIIPVPEHIWKNVEDKFSFENPNPVFTGPYVLVETHEDIRILKRNENYWGKKPAPEYVIFKYIPTYEGALEAAKRNEIDNYGADVTFLDEVRKTNPYWHWPRTGPDLCAAALYVNTKVYPLSLKEVRWAISYAINRTKVIDVVRLGAAIISKSLWGEYVTLHDHVWKHTDIFAKYNVSTYDPAKAIKMLDDLNFKDVDGDGIRETPNGTKLSFDFMSFSWGRVMAELLADELKKVGIEARIRYADPLIWDALTRTGEFEMSWAWHCTGVIDPYQGFYMDFINSGTWDNNWWLRTWATEEYKQLLEEYGKLDPLSPKAKEISRRLVEIVMENLPNIPLHYTIADTMVNSYLWTGWPTEENPYQSCLNWHQGRFTEIVLRLQPTGRLSAETQDALNRKNNLIAVGVALAIVGLVVAIIPMVRKKPQR